MTGLPTAAASSTRASTSRSQEAGPHLIELGIVTSDGSGARRIVHQPRSNYVPWDGGGDWSPDGTRIAFTRTRGFESYNLHVVDAAGGDARALTQSHDAYGSEWSPDSRLIAFSRYDYQQPARNGIWLIRPDGGGETQLTHGEDHGPLWAPDGSAIAFTRVLDRERGAALYTVRPDGSDLRQVAGPGDNLAIDWSPDSRLILFERGRAAGKSFVWSMRRDGGEKRRLGPGDAASWSPDGTKLMFGRGRPTDREVGNARLYVADADGSNARVVFRGAASGIWSADSNRVAVSARGVCIGWGIYVVRVAARSARRISNDCRIRGTAGRDRLRGTNERDIIYGLAGDDVIDANPGDRLIEYYRRFDSDVVLAGPGDDRVFGRRGRDFLDGGPGRDFIAGGIAGDLIRVRDGERDVVVCGGGFRDRVIADRLDSVAPDCELVRRS